MSLLTPSQLKDKENVVIATARSVSGSDGLQKLKADKSNADRLHLFDLDVTKPESVRHAAQEAARLLPDGLDNLVSNAGVTYNPLTSFDDLYVV